jgi:hypothetical protein
MNYYPDKVSFSLGELKDTFSLAIIKEECFQFIFRERTL